MWLPYWFIKTPSPAFFRRRLGTSMKRALHQYLQLLCSNYVLLTFYTQDAPYEKDLCKTMIVSFKKRDYRYYIHIF